MGSGDLSARDILDAINQALYDVHHPKPPKPVCECGSMDIIENHGLAFPGKLNGIYCHRGHRLPGQDIPQGDSPRIDFTEDILHP